MSATESRRRKHLLTDKMKILSAKALAQKIGYLRTMDFPNAVFDSLPRLSFNPGRQIRSKDNLYLVKSGSVIIRHAHYEYFIKDLSPGALFGNLPLFGQTMLGTEALAGSEGVTLGVLDRQTAKRIVETNPIWILDKLGPRLSSIETDHYRVRFQLADSRLAALILELSGEAASVEGQSHEELGEMLGLYRETVTMSLGIMESDDLIKVSRMKITQSEATKYIKGLLASRGLEIGPGLVLIGEDQPWQVFEYNNKCIGIDTNSGLWTGPLGGQWECVSEICTVSSALQAIEFLTEDSLPQMK